MSGNIFTLKQNILRTVNRGNIEEKRIKQRICRIWFSRFSSAHRRGIYRSTRQSNAFGGNRLGIVGTDARRLCAWHDRFGAGYSGYPFVSSSRARC